MFSALDNLNGYQLLTLLAPLVAIMVLIRHREERARSLKWSDVNSLQRGWVFLGMVSPGLSAKVLSLLSEEERQRIIGAGADLTGNPGRLAYPVLDVFFRTKNADKGAPSKDVEELTRWLNLEYEEQPKKLVEVYRRAYL